MSEAVICRRRGKAIRPLAEDDWMVYSYPDGLRTTVASMMICRHDLAGHEVHARINVRFEAWSMGRGAPPRRGHPREAGAVIYR